MSIEAIYMLFLIGWGLVAIVAGFIAIRLGARHTPRDPQFDCEDCPLRCGANLHDAPAFLRRQAD